MTESSRAYDIVLFGATGFTGRLVAAYFAETYPDLNWALAGRSESRLKKLKDDINSPHLPHIIATSDDTLALKSLAECTRVVITVVGPYAIHGTPLLRACAEAGTHYCDLTGEPQWMASVYETISPIAESTGARLVHCCGYDSIPSDLGVLAAQQTMMSRHDCYSTKVSGRAGRYKGAASGGTIASLMLGIEQAASDPAIRKIMQDPYALYPRELPYGLDDQDQQVPRWDENFKQWTAPFIMAPINTKVVRRSNALGSLIYGADFQYDEAMLTNSRGQALLISGVTMLGLLLAALQPTRFLLKFGLPKPGEGPSLELQEHGYFEFFIHAKHPSDKQKSVRITVSGERDPGYGATSRMLAQSGLCLAFDDLSVEGGIWTPASAMGEKLINRLEKVNITFRAAAA